MAAVGSGASTGGSGTGSSLMIALECLRNIQRTCASGRASTDRGVPCRCFEKPRWNCPSWLHKQGPMRILNMLDRHDRSFTSREEPFKE